ncbi:MAG TPA: hypothetical protein VJR29_01275, partial [bacterium]|nr:hypothetical protein [bacterium]
SGMYGGILLGHELEVRAGLRERTSGSIALVDGLSTLLTFQVAGRLNRSLLGEGMRRWERGVEVRTEALSRALPNPPLFQRGEGRVPPFEKGGLGGISPEPAFAGEGSFIHPRPEPLGPDRVYMSGEDGKKGGNDNPRRRTTLQGLTRPSLLPQASRLPLFLYNVDYRVPNLSLRAREIEHAASGGHIQRRIQEALETYLRLEKEPAVLIYRDGAPFGEAQQGELRIDLFRYFREYQLPEDFTLTVVVPATQTAIHYGKDPRGTIQIETRDVIRKALSRETPAPPRQDSVPPRPSSRPDPAELRAGMERLISQVESNAEQNPAFRLTKGRIGLEELGSFAEVFSAKPPVHDRRFTVVWREKGGGQVQFMRDGEAIRAEWKAHQTPQQTYWYLPSHLVMGQFQFVGEGEYAAYGWEAEPGYSRGMEQRLQTLWTNLGVAGSFDKAAALEEGAERRGVLLARLAQHWVQNEGSSSSKTWSPITLSNLLQIHRTLELALAHLELGLVRRFQERLSSQTYQSYRRVIEGVVQSSGDPRLLPLGDKLENLVGERYLPLDEGLRAAFVQQLYHGLKRPRFPLENYRLLRDPRRLGEVYRLTLRDRLAPVLDAIQSGQRASPQGDWTYLLTADAKQLSERETGQRRDIEFFLGEMTDHARILTGQGGFHRDFLREVFMGDHSLLRPYLVFRGHLDQLPVEMRVQYRIRELPNKEEIEARLARTRP